MLPDRMSYKMSEAKFPSENHESGSFKVNTRYSKYATLKICIYFWTMFVGLFVLRLNVPVNNFSVMSGRSHRFLGN